MAAAPTPDAEQPANRLVLEGTAGGVTATRYSPAGVPVTRFAVTHRSRRLEAGLVRTVQCRMAVLAAGTPIAEQAARLCNGSAVRVTGYLHQGRTRYGPGEPELHAERIEPLERTEPDLNPTED